MKFNSNYCDGYNDGYNDREYALLKGCPSDWECYDNGFKAGRNRLRTEQGQVKLMTKTVKGWK